MKVVKVLEIILTPFLLSNSRSRSRHFIKILLNIIRKQYLLMLSDTVQTVYYNWYKNLFPRYLSELLTSINSPRARKRNWISERKLTKFKTFKIKTINITIWALKQWRRKHSSHSCLKIIHWNISRNDCECFNSSPQSHNTYFVIHSNIVQVTMISHQSSAPNIRNWLRNPNILVTTYNVRISSFTEKNDFHQYVDAHQRCSRFSIFPNMLALKGRISSLMWFQIHWCFSHERMRSS